MEIERKYIPKTVPENLQQYPFHEIEQGYICTQPTIRVRKMDESYVLTCKSSGMLAHEEFEMPLSKESYDKLCRKTDGILITKRRYLIPLGSKYTVELDVFKGSLDGLVLAEVEFPSVEEAEAFIPPLWFGKDVTYDKRYYNSEMSKGAFTAF